MTEEQKQALEQEKLEAEIYNLNAQARKAIREEEKLVRDKWLNPVFVMSSLIVAIATLYKAWHG